MAITSTTPSTAFTIEIAKASLVYSGRDVAKKAFRANPTNQNLPLQLWFAYKILEWTYINDSSNQYIKLMRNYTLMLCGQYIVEATGAIGQGGVVVLPVIAPIFNWRWEVKSFTVGMSGSLVNAGSLTFTVNDNNIAQDSVQFGFSNASPFPRTGTVPTGQQTYSVTYTQTSITITLAQNVNDGEQYTLTYVRFGGTQAFSGGGTSLPNDAGHEGQVLFTDGAGNPYWADVIIDITSASFSDSVTVNDARMVHNQLDIYWNEGARWLINTGDDAEFVRLIGGGFTIQNIDDFDATTQSITMKVILRGLNS